MMDYECCYCGCEFETEDVPVRCPNCKANLDVDPDTGKED